MTDVLLEVCQYAGAALGMAGNLWIVSSKRERRLIGFYIWLVANPLLIIFYIGTQAWGLCAMGTYYFIMACIGYYKHRNSKNNV